MEEWKKQASDKQMMIQVHPPFPFSYRDLGEGKERKGKERKEIDEILFFLQIDGASTRDGKVVCQRYTCISAP